MIPNDTKPEKADASAVEVLREVQWGLFHSCPSCGGPENGYWRASWEQYGHKPSCRLAAALQSSSSAEAELRALLSSAKTTIALLMADKADLQDRVKVLEKALEPFSEVVAHDIGEDESDVDQFWPFSSRYNKAPLITVGDLRRARAALNHGKGEDARAALTKDRGGEHGE